MMRRSFMWLRACAVALVVASAAQAWAAQATTVRGRLGRTAEAGGWLINTSTVKYLILNPQGFQEEGWFREGAEVVATGEIRPETVTTYQEGIPFEVRTMRAQGRGAPAAGAGAAAAPRGLTRVTVTGDALVRPQPDTAVLTVAVVTQNASATEAQAENASRTEAVVRAVRAAAGAGAEVRTSGYSLSPQYAYKEGAPPTITSYIARNGVTVTMGDLTKVGATIDAASRAGANSVDGLSFTLRRDEQARSRALADATREALAKARVVAEALGGRVVRVLEVQEAGTFRPPVPVPYARDMRTAETLSVAQTPIEPGTLEITAQVQIVVEVETRE